MSIVKYEKTGREGVNPDFSFYWGEICAPSQYFKLKSFSEAERLEVLLAFIRNFSVPHYCQQPPDIVQNYGHDWTHIGDMNEFEFLEKLGEGSYGHVYKVKHKGGRIFALKLFDIHFTPTRTPSQWDATSIYEFCLGRKEALFLLEASLRRKNRHIPKFYDCGFCIFEGKARNYILMEFIEGTVFLGASVGDQKFFENVTEQVFESIKDIHSMGYAHCDISPANLMITNSGRVMVIDFGTISGEHDAADYMMGTINPPENYGDRIPDIEQLFAVDVWCAAYSLLSMARGMLKKNLLPDEKTLVECLEDLETLIDDAEKKVKIPFVIYDALSLNMYERPYF